MVVMDAEPLVSIGPREALVSVVVPLYNYERYIEGALDTVREQTLRDLALIVIDDRSKDSSAEVVARWMDNNRDCGLGLHLLQNRQNAKLATTRNTGIAYASSEFCFFLDADNELYPRCLEAHVRALRARPAAMAAYSLIEVFDAEESIIGNNVFNRQRLKNGNYIDAMAMLRRDPLVAIGGYDHIEYGWEDYDLWLRMCEADAYAVQVPEILSRYRVHHASMLRTQTNVDENIGRLKRNMARRHPWLRLH